MNRLFLLFLLITALSSTTSAQVSVQTRYHTLLLQDDSPVLADNIVEYSAHYWTRLKRYRIEFFPGVLYQAEPSFRNEIRNIGVTIPVSFYPLDFVNDCDCPTFSKNSFWFQRGFFIRLTTSWTKNISSQQAESVDQLLSGSISAGLDLGLSDLITVTPLLGYSRMQSISGMSFQGDFFHVGISALFRFDYKKY